MRANGSLTHEADLSHVFGDAPVKPTVLGVDDEPQIRRVVRNALDDVAERVIEASNGAEALDLAASGEPALVVLDLTLPDMDGLDLCRDLRAFSKAPILVLSARQSDRDKVALLDAGADDYLVKPFSTAELQARVRALLRRSVGRHDDGAERVVIGDLEINLAHRTVRRRGAEIHLTPTEWGLLRTFLTHR